jgi:HEPN domain-containing protein
MVAETLHKLDPNKYLRTVPFHCQQAAEKAIKGFLSYKKIKFKQTHDIGLIAELIVPIHPELEGLLTEADELTTFATQFRYPDANKREPSVADSEFALGVAKKVFEKMISLIPFETPMGI